uniref:Uncharacterized protein n=1 Tax=Caenorhabditis japonica TaxID=281687 RepID=A0A8R1EJZ1_CAEJA
MQNLLGMSCLNTLISLLCFVFADYENFTIWAFCLTASIGVISLIPEIFCHFLNMAVQFIFWIIYFLFCFAKFIRREVIEFELGVFRYQPLKQSYLLAGIFLQFIFTATVIVIFYRILKAIYHNRQAVKPAMLGVPSSCRV